MSEPYFDDLQHSDDDEDAEEPEDDAVRSVACESTPCYTHHSDAQREEDHTNDVLDDEGSDPGNAAQSECVRVSNRDMLRVVRERHVETRNAAASVRQSTYVSHVEVHSHRGRAKEMRSVHRHSPIMTAAAHTRPTRMGRVLVRESLRAYIGHCNLPGTIPLHLTLTLPYLHGANTRSTGSSTWKRAAGRRGWTPAC